MGAFDRTEPPPPVVIERSGPERGETCLHGEHVVAQPRTGTIEGHAVAPHATCVPSPSRNLPPVASCSSHAVAAVTNGLRGNATATPVESSRSGAACDAKAALR